MQCYTELLPPAAVTHAASLPFLGPTAHNVVVAKTSLLQVFRLSQARDATSSNEGDGKSKLVLVGEYPLAGTVASLGPVKLLSTKSGGDAILIAFKDAKLSLLEWDPDNHTISTVSIHYYEGENVYTQPFGPSLVDSGSILTVDPSSRCAALKFGPRQLAILPFRQAGDELGEGAEDAFDPDLDVAPPSATIKRAQSGANDSLDPHATQTPYKASFVLPLTALDPALTHPVHLAFLYEYREPTFGILSTPVQPSSALQEERKDVVSYSVFTLDLEQRASTNLISIQNLPSDLWKLIPLPLPVGGALLVGTNEFVYVDQSGKTSAVAVNEFATAVSSLSMADRSDLNLKLEDCEIQSLDDRIGGLLVVLNDGSLAVLSFSLSGRSVTGLDITKVASENGGTSVAAAPSCSALINSNHIFVGSEDGDSTLLSWTKSAPTFSRKRSHAQMLGQDSVAEEDEEVEDVDEDDLYASTAEAAVKRSASLTSPTAAEAASSYSFDVLGLLPSLGPMRNVCFGRSAPTAQDKLEIVAACGRGRGSRLAFMSKGLIPQLLGFTSFHDAKDAWSLYAKAKDGPGEEVSPHHNFFFVFDGTNIKVHDIIPADSSLLDVTYKERIGTEFEHEGDTLCVSTLANHTRVVQCRRNEIRTYDSTDLSLSQIVPMMDDETDAELKIVHVDFCDPYLLVLRDDGSVQVLKVDDSGDVEALEAEGAIKERRWHSGCLYRGEICDSNTVAFLLGEEGGLHVFSLPDLHASYTVTGLSNLPIVLSPSVPQRRTGAKETIVEMLFADIGAEELTQSYLILRSAMDDLTIYEPWRSSSGPWNESLRFRKVPLTYMPKFDETVAEDSDGRPTPLRSIKLDGRRVVYIPGAIPSVLAKEPGSLPKVLPLQISNVQSLTPVHREGCQHGFGVLDREGTWQDYHLPHDIDLGTGWCIRKMSVMGEEVRHVAFHEERGMYVVATCKDVDFVGGEEEGRKGGTDDMNLHAQVPQYTLHLLSSKSHDITHSFVMPYLEVITSLKVMSLEISEHTHEQKAMIVVGTSVQRGQDMPAKGALNVFEILDVVPEPDRNESGAKLHLASREETKGAVTAVESFPGGFIGTGQGQKIMIRGLKEDGSCLPVAFLDAQCHNVQLKTLPQTGMWLAGDAWKGLWFGGFTEEPYKLTVLGKSRSHMEVVTAEFLPFEGQLFILIMDADMDLHVLQYDPENPKSLAGTRLLHRSTIHIGHFPTSMTLLPSTLSTVASQQQQQQNGSDSALSHILTTSLTGSIGLITPVDESTYRRLNLIQTHLTSVLEHAAGLNPRAYRAVQSEAFGGRGVVDGNLVQRLGELGAARRAEVMSRAGVDGWGVRGFLEIVGGGGLEYF